MPSPSLEEETEKTICRLVIFFKTIEVAHLRVGLITRLVNAEYDTFPKIMNIDLIKLQGIVGSKVAEKIHLQFVAILQNPQPPLEKIIVGSGHLGKSIGINELGELLKEHPDLFSESPRSPHPKKIDKSGLKKCKKDLATLFPDIDITEHLNKPIHAKKFLPIAKDAAMVASFHLKNMDGLLFRLGSLQLQHSNLGTGTVKEEHEQRKRRLD